MRRGVPFEGAMGLDMARKSFKTGGTLIQVAVDVDVVEFPVLEVGFMVTASPPDLGMSDSDLFFFGQRGQ